MKFDLFLEVIGPLLRVHHCQVSKVGYVAAFTGDGG